MLCYVGWAGWAQQAPGQGSAGFITGYNQSSLHCVFQVLVLLLDGKDAGGGIQAMLGQRQKHTDFKSPRLQLFLQAPKPPKQLQRYTLASAQSSSTPQTKI